MALRRAASRAGSIQGEVVRPAWRVEFVAKAPAGDHRNYIDSVTGAVLAAKSNRSEGPRGPAVKPGLLDGPGQ